MDDEKIGKILSDPDAMEAIRNIAKSLKDPEKKEAAGEAEAKTEAAVPASLMDSLPALLGSFGVSDHRYAIISALAPHVNPERRSKLKKAEKIVKIAGMAGKLAHNAGGFLNDD